MVKSVRIIKMSSEQIAQFIEQTGADQKMANKYLMRNDYDVAKAVREFYGGMPPPPKGFSGSPAEWYAGGSKSGVAVMSNDHGANSESTPTPAPAPHGSYGTSGPKQIVLANTDYSIPGEPKTRIRFEFTGMPPLTLTVAMSATVGDIRSYVIANREELNGKDFKLVQKPNTELNDDSLTVEAGKLKMAQIKVVV